MALLLKSDHGIPFDVYFKITFFAGNTEEIVFNIKGFLFQNNQIQQSTIKQTFDFKMTVGNLKYDTEGDFNYIKQAYLFLKHNPVVDIYGTEHDLTSCVNI